MGKNSRIRYKVFACIYLILITILFLLPGSALPKENWFDTIRLDKLIHVFLFAVLTYLWMRALVSGISRNKYLVIAAAILYGILIELSQELFIVNRSMDIYDIVADIAGVFIGAVMVRGYKKNKPL
jgi:VanZ family protein